MSSPAALVTFVDISPAYVRAGNADIWADTSVPDIVETARMVVGPDEPIHDMPPHEADAHYWAALANVLADHGVAADAVLLQQLRHDVVLSEQLLARLL